MKAVHDGDKVALSIDSDSMPYKVMLVRGAIRTDVVDGIAPEYESATIRNPGQEAGSAWFENMRPIRPQMVRVFITTGWVGILDFENRFPSAVEQAQAAAPAPVD